jgi:TM2 domain-containing membrane protein YozV
MSREMIALKRTLSPQELEILKTELERKKKSVGLAYALWFFLSFLGVHKFYLGKIGQGLLYVLGPGIALFTLLGGVIAVGQNGAQGGGRQRC